MNKTLIFVALMSMLLISACVPVDNNSDVVRLEMQDKSDESKEMEKNEDVKNSEVAESQIMKKEMDTSDQNTDLIKDSESMMQNKYAGNVLSGTTTPYVEFNQADFEMALSQKKTIVLNFYANWCPSCRAEQPFAEEAFSTLNNSHVVGFRVDYKDANTDEFETALAKKYGITYQHTKIIIDKTGEQAVKSLESWDSARYISEIMKIA